MTRNYLFFSLAVSFIFLSSCASVPMTKDEFRNSQKQSEQSAIQSKLPYSKVKRILTDRFEQCMSRASRAEDRNDKTVVVRKFKPSVEFSKNSGFAALQIDTEYGGSYSISMYIYKKLGLYKMPKGGRYIVIADVKKKGKGTEVKITNVTDYMGADRKASDVTVKMIQFWVKGERVHDCPIYN